jgi:lysophospholipase L1-like esterase
MNKINKKSISLMFYGPGRYLVFLLLTILPLNGQSPGRNKYYPAHHDWFEKEYLHSQYGNPQYKLKIIAFGNSTTAERNTIQQVYAQRLPGLLAQCNIEAVVINRGVGGSHTGHLKDNDHHKVQHALDRFQIGVLDEHPDIVIMQFGINDSYVDSDDPEGPSRIPLKKFRSNMNFMLKKLHKNDIRIILLTPNAFGTNREPWRHKRLEEYVEVIRDLAIRKKIPFIDVYSLYREYDSTPGRQVDDLLLDGVHPNDLGHELLAEKLAEMICALY